MEINIERIEKLAQFLDDLEEAKFDFREVVSERDLETGCGAVCCAIGWCPSIFPDQIQWNKQAEWRLSIDGFSVDYIEAAEELLGICDSDALLLFAPLDERDLDTMDISQHSWYVVPTGSECKPSDVAKNLRAYVKEKTQ